MNIAQVGLIILIPPSKESKLDFFINHLLPQDKTSLDSPLVISFSTSILSNRCASHGCCKDWKIDRLSPIIFHDLWHLWLAVCWTLWKLENWPKLLTQLDCHNIYGPALLLMSSPAVLQQSEARMARIEDTVRRNREVLESALSATCILLVYTVWIEEQNWNHGRKTESSLSISW